MRLKLVAWVLAGSALTFGACAAQQADGPRGPVADAAVDAVRDALGLDVAPAKDAQAAPTGADAPCSGGFAILELPGRSSDSLAGTHAVICGPDAVTAGAPDGWCASIAIVYVREGAVGFACGAKTPSVRFIVPPA